MGLTRIKVKNFLLGSLMGFLPTTFILSLIGDHISDWKNPLLYILIFLYLLMIAGPVIYQKKKGNMSL
jgi:uncharacterized membrane protein YdjX (TVP38/TMEM64 family)